MTHFHLGRDAAHGDGLDTLDRHLIGNGDVEVSVSEKGLARGISYIRHSVHITIVKGVIQSDTFVVDAQVTTVDAPLWAVHTAILGAISVIQQFGRKTGETCSFFSLEKE